MKITANRSPSKRRSANRSTSAAETATDARLLHAETGLGQLHDLLVPPGRNAIDQVIERGLWHRLRRLQQGITLQFRFAAAVQVTRPRLPNADLLAGDRDEPPLMAETRHRAVRLAGITLATTLRDFVLQQALGHGETHLDRERGEALTTHLDQGRDIQRQLDFSGLVPGLPLDLTHSAARLADPRRLRIPS
jgi:hypothetical protein